MSETQKKEYVTRVVLSFYNRELRNESKIAQELLKNQATDKPVPGFLLGFQARLRQRDGQTHLEAEQKDGASCLSLNYEVSYSELLEYLAKNDAAYGEKIKGKLIDFFEVSQIGNERLTLADYYQEKHFQVYIFTVQIDGASDKEFSLEDKSVLSYLQEFLENFESFNYSVLEYHLLKVLGGFSGVTGVAESFPDLCRQLLQKSQPDLAPTPQQNLIVSQMCKNFFEAKILELPFYKQDSGFFDHDRPFTYELK